MERLRQERRWKALGAIAAAALVVAIASGAGGADAPSAAGPTDAATAFYREVLEIHVFGVPDEATRRRLAPRLSPGLTSLLAKADAAEIAYHDATRGEVPPLVEGDLFSSLFEGANGLDGVTCEAEKERARCTVALRYADAAQEGATPAVSTWKDRVVLVPAPPGGAISWLVDDVEYGGDWEFMHKGTLRGVLENVIRSGHEEAALAKEEGRLLGGWVYESGDTEFEQFSLGSENGRQVFRSWLHERPEMVGEWTRNGDALTIRVPDGSKIEASVVSVTDGRLELRFAGTAEKAVFRRPASAPAPSATATP